jgi:hypothetical protein
MAHRGLTVVDRIGQRVGKLVVLERTANKQEGNSVRACWLCECDCGNKIIVTGQSLSKSLLGKGGTKSCGCLVGKATKHGLFKTKIYGVWANMIQRCTNPKNSGFMSYGGRGITVSEEWKDFKTFFADMGHPPTSRTLDRINNELGYSKENCRWATKNEQGNNRRSNLYITLYGKKQTLSQWAKETGLSNVCISNRLKSGWTIEKALTLQNQRAKS